MDDISKSRPSFGLMKDVLKTSETDASNELSMRKIEAVVAEISFFKISAKESPLLQDFNYLLFCSFLLLQRTLNEAIGSDKLTVSK